jgi:NADPH2:quinone reductase
VLEVGELPAPEPGPGEVRVRVRFSGINPGDTKKRQGFFGSAMPYPRVVPHSDGAGVIDCVGPGVDGERVGRRVWVFGAQSYRASGTAAEYTVVPSDLAVDLPDTVDDALGACLGIPGITAHRCVFADGPVAGATVLVQGVLGGVGSIAAALATWGGATVIGTVRRTEDLSRVPDGSVRHLVALNDPDPAAAIRAVAPGGIDRIIEVALAANADLDDAVLTNNGVIAAYATNEARTSIPFWTLLFHNVTVRLFGSDDFPAGAKLQAAADLTTVAAVGGLTIRTAPPYPLADIAAAHDAVDAGARQGRVLLDITR